MYGCIPGLALGKGIEYLRSGFKKTLEELQIYLRLLDLAKEVGILWLFEEY